MVDSSPHTAESIAPLQACWVEPALYVWGWDAARRRPLARNELLGALSDISFDGLLGSAARSSKVRLWLPARCVRMEAAEATSARRVPAGRRTKPPRAKPVSDMVEAPALAFARADAVDLLLGLESAPRRCADSLRYWAGLARYAVALLSRQQFFPDIIERQDGSFAGVWRLVVAERDELTALERLVSAMPPVCRSVVVEDVREMEATRLADGFLRGVADAFIRRSLANDEFFADIPRRARTEDRWELRWLASLITADGSVRGSAEELAGVAAGIQSWISQLDEETDGGPPRLSFTLVEPDENDVADGAWKLRLDLKSPSDGRALDVAAVWAEPDGSPSILGRRLQNRRQQFLAELSRAAEVFPEIRRLLSEAAPMGLELTVGGAYAFLRERAALLAAQGFEVNLPSWAQQSGEGLGLRLNVRPHAPGDGGPLTSLGLSSLVDFEWRVAVGDQQISVDEFERLAAFRTPLVRVHGRWVSFDPQAARRALDFLRAQPAGRMTLAQAIRTASGVEDHDTGLPIVGLSGEAWLEDLLRQTPRAEVRPLDQPPGFVGTLRPYQLRGLAWLEFMDRLGIGACLADDMGLGKTVQLIALLLHERAIGQAVGPTLLFAPMSVVGNWEREIERFAPSLRVLVHHGPDRLSGERFVEEAARHDIVITTYGLAARELALFQKVPWHRVALDEAQKIKNPAAHQTHAVRGLQAPRRVALTGTPLENRLSELWSIMEMLNPGLLGGASAFRTRFAVPIEKLGDPQRAAQLRRLIQPFVLRRLKSDPNVACDLPDKIEMKVFCNLTPEQAAFYDRTVRQMLDEIESATGIRRRGLILATLTKLKQICNHPVHLLGDNGPLDGRSGKCERLIEMLEEVLDEGDAALVFTQYREMGMLLERLMTERLRTDVLFLHGGTPMKRRNELIARYQDPAGPARIFLLSLKAGGFGLNLTRANHVFHFDRWWNPAVEEQATDRAHRIGQTRVVQVHKFVCIGTVEDRIDRLLTEKSALADRIVGSGDEWLTGLSTDELRDYLALSAEAVAEA